MTDLLILNGFVVTMDPDHRIFKDGAVAINDNRIVAVGKSSDLKRKYSTESTIDARNKLVLPGLIDVHTHVTLAIGRGYCEDQGAEGSLYGVAMRLGKFVTKSDRHILGKLGCLEELRFGATTIAEGAPDISQVAPAVQEIGIRAVLSDLLNDYDRETLIQKQQFEYIQEKGELGLKNTIKLINEWDGKANNRINCVFGPQAADFCSEDLLRKVREAADEYGKRITVHLAQSMIEVKHTQDVYGKTPFQHLRDIGLLGPDVIAAHCYHCTDEDIGILKSTGTNVAHNPGLNAKRGLVMPLLKFLEQGITVGLGTDNYYGDMTNNMLMTILSARLKDGQGTEPKPMRVLELATIEGAKALGLEQEIGSLEPGKKADLILVNMRRPHMVPIINPVVNLIHSGNGNDVETVIVDGRIIEHDGVIQTVNEASVLDQAQEISDRIWKDYFDEYGPPPY